MIKNVLYCNALKVNLVKEYNPSKSVQLPFGKMIYAELIRNNKNIRIKSLMDNNLVDDDVSLTTSLTSTFVLDLLTDRIVAEYTGRLEYADDNFEIVRKLCLFYNAKCMFEQNKKGIFSYFLRMNCLHLLAETPLYLKELKIIKEIGYGNKGVGINATVSVNAFADRLTREWLIKPVVMQNEETGEEYTVPNLMLVRNRAFLQELAAYNPYGNFDRIRAFGMAMLYREEKVILYLGDMKRITQRDDINYAGNDAFFTRNYEDKFGIHSIEK